MSDIYSYKMRAEEWKGQDVQEIVPLVTEMLEARTEARESSDGEPDWFDEVLNRLNSANHLWPDDISNAFELYAIDESGKYLYFDNGLSVGVLDAVEEQ